MDHRPPSSPPAVPVTPAENGRTSAGVGPRFAEPVHHSRWPSVLMVLFVLLIGGGIGYWLWTSPPGGATAGGRGGRFMRPTTMPVVAAPARKGNLTLYLDEPGTVVAFNTVTVRTRVEGQLVKVAFQEGQLVKQGDLLAEVDPRPFQAALAQAQGQLAKDEAQLKNAQADLERYKSAPETVTKQQIDTQSATVQQFGGTLEADKAQVENAQLQLSYCTITAPITGRVGLRLVDAGNIVHVGDANGLVVITQLQPIAVYFSIPQGNIPDVVGKLNAGQQLTVEAYDSDMSHLLATGKLVAADNQVDPTTLTLRLKGVFQNEQNTLYPNEFVNARLMVDTLRDVVIVPSAGIQQGPDFSYSYVVQPNQTVKMVKVTPGPTRGLETVVESGLSAGDQVVTDGVDKLQDGSKVMVGREGAAGSGGGRRATSGPSTEPAMGGAGMPERGGPRGGGRRHGSPAASQP